MINSSPLVIDGKFICTRSSMRDVTAQWSIEGHLRGEAEKWEILHRTGVTLTSQLELEQIVQIVTDAASGCPARHSARSSTTCRAKGEKYMLYTLSGVPREAFSKFPMPRNTAVFAPTFAGEASCVGRHHQGSRATARRSAHGMPKGHLPVRSYLAVPVVSRSGDVLGGLFFGHPRPACSRSRGADRAASPRRPRSPSTTRGCSRRSQRRRTSCAIERGARAARRRAHQRAAHARERQFRMLVRASSTTRSTCWTRRQRRELEPRRAAHQGLPRRGDRRAALLAVLHAEDRAAGRAASGRSTTARDGQVRSRRLARAQGRQPVLGERGHRSDLRRATAS